MPSRRARDDFDFAACVLDAFDDDGVRRRFGSVIGVAVARDLRPVIERQLTEAGGLRSVIDAWSSGREDERTAQTFIRRVNEFLWMPLMTFLGEAEQASGQPERLADLRKDFEAAVKRDGFWHKRIDELTSWAATRRSGGHA